MSISDSDFVYLIKLDKKFKEDKQIALGPHPIKWTRDIISLDRKEFFLLDFFRGSIEIKKITINKRYRQSIVLLRYDSMGMHTNPDGIRYDGPHVHIYKEGYDDKFAFPVSKIGVNEKMSSEEIMTNFLKYCNVVDIPDIQTTF